MPPSSCKGTYSLSRRSVSGSYSTTAGLPAAYFACARLGRTLKLRLLHKRVYHAAAKRIHGIPEFRFHAVADGLKNILYGAKWRAGLESTADPPLSPTLPFGSWKMGKVLVEKRRKGLTTEIRVG